MQTIQRESIISFPFLGGLSINPPASIHLFGRDIYLYGIIIALGFILAILYCSHHCSKFGLSSDDMYDYFILLVPISIIGARLYYVLFELEYYLQNPSEIPAIWQGGLAIYGGIIAGVLLAFFLCRRKKLSFPAFLDIVIFGLLIGQSIGRWGNFMNREAFGSETMSFFRMGLTSPDGTTIYVHPTFLYESVWNLCCFIFLVIWTGKGKRKYDGQCTLIYFFWYGLGRTWIEGLRTDSLYLFNSGIRVSQLLSFLLFLAAGTLLFLQSRRNHPPEKLFVNRAKTTADETTVSE